jgi:hypothetical protein
MRSTAGTDARQRAVGAGGRVGTRTWSCFVRVCDNTELAGVVPRSVCVTHQLSVGDEPAGARPPRLPHRSCPPCRGARFGAGRARQQCLLLAAPIPHPPTHSRRRGATDALYAAGACRPPAPPPARAAQPTFDELARCACVPASRTREAGACTPRQALHTFATCAPQLCGRPASRRAASVRAGAVAERAAAQPCWARASSLTRCPRAGCAAIPAATRSRGWRAVGAR